MVKDTEFRDGGGRGPGWRGGVRSTVLAAVFIRMRSSCRTAQGDVLRMYVRTTSKVRVDNEILVMYQPDRGFFGGVQGRCRCCLCEKRTPECCLYGSVVLHRWAQWAAAQWAASGVTVFEGANKLAFIRNVQSACCSLQHVCYMTMHVPFFAC